MARHFGDLIFRLCLTYLLFIMSKGCCGQTMEDTHNLMQNLLQNYDKRVRPASNQSQPTVVNATFDLVAIQEFDEVMEKLTTVLLMYVSWYDERMRWNPFSYNNTYSALFSPDEVWVPELVLVNQVNTIKKLGDDWIKIRFMYDGTAFWNPGSIFHSTCAADVTYFPFDIQHCVLTFVPWTYHAGELYIISNMDKALQTYFSENGEWKLVGSEVMAGLHPAGSFSFLNVNISIERRPTFFFVNVILPIIFMGILNILVFILPAESGERMSYAITVLLAIAVFLTLVGDNMPKTSQPMSSLCYFLIINLVLSSLICFGIIYNMVLYFRSDDIQIPPWLAALTRKMNCSKSNTTNVEILTPPTESEEKEKSEIPSWAQPAFQEKTSPLPVTWRDVSRLSDKLMGLGALLWLIVSSVVFMVMVANRKPVEISI